MTIFNLANLDALVRNLVQATGRACGIAGPTADPDHTYRIAWAETEATQDARLHAILAPLTESIARVHKKLDTILAKRKRPLSAVLSALAI